MIANHLFALTSQGVFLSKDTFLQLFLEGWIVDGRAGGLVIGRSHSEGNIYMIRQANSGFEFASHLEGGEYLVNHGAFTKSEDRVEAINNDYTLAAKIAHIPYGIRTLNTTAAPFDKLLLIDHRGQFIVNRHATSRCLEELARINETGNDFAHCSLHELLKRPIARKADK